MVDSVAPLARHIVQQIGINAAEILGDLSKPVPALASYAVLDCSRSKCYHDHRANASRDRHPTVYRELPAPPHTIAKAHGLTTSESDGNKGAQESKHSRARFDLPARVPRADKDPKRATRRADRRYADALPFLRPVQALRTANRIVWVIGGLRVALSDRIEGLYRRRGRRSGARAIESRGARDKAGEEADEVEEREKATGDLHLEGESTIYGRLYGSSLCADGGPRRARMQKRHLSSQSVSMYGRKSKLLIQPRSKYLMCTYLLFCRSEFLNAKELLPRPQLKPSPPQPDLVSPYLQADAIATPSPTTNPRSLSCRL